MSTALPLASGVGRVVAVPVIHPAQITADVAETVHKVYPGITGRIVGVQFISGVHGGTVVATDLDMIPYKNTTALASAVPAVDSSTAATGASLSATLTATAAQLAITASDYISIDYDITGGTGPTVDGAGAIFYIARE